MMIRLVYHSAMEQATIHTTPQDDGPTLAELRAAAGLSSRAAAAALGVSQPRIVQMEKDGVVDHIDKIAKAYGVDDAVVRDANRRTRSR